MDRLHDVVAWIREEWRRFKAEFARVLEDPEEAFQVVKQGTGLFIGMSVAAVAVSFGIFYALQGDTLQLFASTLLFWMGYLFSHYTVTGQFVHQKASSSPGARSLQEKVMAVLGVLLILVGVTALPLTVARGSVVETYAAVATVLAGYLFAHYGLTEALL